MTDKEIIIVGGANGSGKTTFANAYLEINSNYYFLNADEIAKKPSTSQTKRILHGVQQIGRELTEVRFLF